MVERLGQQFSQLLQVLLIFQIHKPVSQSLPDVQLRYVRAVDPGLAQFLLDGRSLPAGGKFDLSVFIQKLRFLKLLLKNPVHRPDIVLRRLPGRLNVNLRASEKVTGIGGLTA